MGTHTPLPWVEQSNGPSHPLLLVTHGWTWELGFVLSVLFPSSSPWASLQTCPCPPVLSQAGRGSPCRCVGGQAGSIQRYQLVGKGWGSCPGMGWQRLTHLTGPRNVCPVPVTVRQVLVKESLL